MKKLFACSILFTVMGINVAAMAGTELQEKQEVLKVIKKYAESTACETTFEKSDSPDTHVTSLRDVFTIERDADVGSRYFVFWSGDVGCAGGSGTYSSYLSEVSRISDTRPFLVMAQDVLGDNIQGTKAGQINTRFTKSIKKLTNGNLEIISWNYADKKFGGRDMGNQPVNKFKYTLAFDQKNDKWNVVNQILLERAK
jgi:hypothetical protein